MKRSIIPTVPALCAAIAWLLAGVDGKILFAKTPASPGKLMREGFPVGNGKLGGRCGFEVEVIMAALTYMAAIPFGQPGSEKVNLNIDSLWSGGPFESNVSRTSTSLPADSRILQTQTNMLSTSGQAYNGGNPTSDRSQLLWGIRENVMMTGIGSMSPISCKSEILTISRSYLAPQLT